MKKTGIVFSLMLLAGILLAAGQALALASQPLTVALIFDIGGRGDGGFNDAAQRGLEKAVSEMGVRAVYIEHRRNLELAHAVDEAAASDAQVIIGVGFAFSEKLRRLALQYPGKKFICVDYSAEYDEQGRLLPLPANLAGLSFREEEGSYLVGAIAALKSKTGRIGFVGGMESQLIRRFQAGYAAGARAVRPDIQVLSRYAGITGRAFNNPDRGYRLAMRLYRDGADVIYHASGVTGNGVFRAAKKMNRLAIGVDIDQSAQAPGHVLTSMTKHVDVAVFNSVQDCAAGRFVGGLATFGLKEKGVGFVYDENNKKLFTDDIYARVSELQAKIIAGEVKVASASDRPFVLSRQNLQDLLADLRAEVGQALYKLDGDLKRSARALAGRDLQGEDARLALRKLYAGNPYIIDCETVSDRGIMLVVEPPAHRSSEGADISKQAHMIKLFRTHRPVLSGSFRSVEGPQAVVIHHPVLSADGRFAGSIAALFAPEYLLSGIIGPVAAGLPVGFFLMQTDGLIIYDVATNQIGRAAAEKQRRPFLELTKAAGKMAAAAAGKDTYTYPGRPGEEPVTKVIYWQTVTLHGTAWRLGIDCAVENLEK
jgi:basic membrane protein A